MWPYYVLAVLALMILVSLGSEDIIDNLEDWQSEHDAFDETKDATDQSTDEVR